MNYMLSFGIGIFPQVFSVFIIFDNLVIFIPPAIRCIIGAIIGWPFALSCPWYLGRYLSRHRVFPRLENRTIFGMTGYIISMVFMKWALWRMYVDKVPCVGYLIIATLSAEFFISCFVFEAYARGFPAYTNYPFMVLLFFILNATVTVHEINLWVSELVFFIWSFLISQEEKEWRLKANPGILYNIFIAAFALDLCIVLRVKMSKQRYVWYCDRNTKSLVLPL